MWLPDGILMKGLRGERWVMCECRVGRGFSVTVNLRIVSDRKETACQFSTRVRLHVTIWDRLWSWWCRTKVTGICLHVARLLKYQHDVRLLSSMLPESSLVFSGLHSAPLALRINNNKFYHNAFQEIYWVLSLKDCEGIHKLVKCPLTEAAKPIRGILTLPDCGLFFKKIPTVFLHFVLQLGISLVIFSLPGKCPYLPNSLVLVCT